MATIEVHEVGDEVQLDFIKQLFWGEHEVVMQLHVNDENKTNLHPYCLHLWRPQTEPESQAERERWAKQGEVAPEWFFPSPIPMPPKIFV